MSEKATETVSNEQARNYRKVREGLVVSDKMEKTVVVSVEDRVKHALYGKVLRRTSKLKAHDEQNDAHVGDTGRPRRGFRDRALVRPQRDRKLGAIVP